MNCLSLIHKAKKEIEKLGGSATFLSDNHAFFNKNDLLERRYLDLYAQLLYKHSDENSKEKIRLLSRTLYQNRQIIENIGLNKELENLKLSDLEGKSVRNYVEYVDDLVRRKVRKATIDTFVKKELSGSYKYSDFYRKNQAVIDEILNLGGKNELKMLFHKIEKIVSEPQSEVDRLFRIVKEGLVNLPTKLEKTKDSKIVFSNDDFIVIHVGSYDDILKLGSPAWCIQQDETYWKDYVAFPNRQYIVYDKNGNILYGATIDSIGEIEACHDCNDKRYDTKKIPEVITQNFVPMPKETILNYLNTHNTKNVVTTAGFGLIDELNEEVSSLNSRRQKGEVDEPTYNKLMSTAMIAAVQLGTADTINRLLREPFTVSQEHNEAILFHALSRKKEGFSPKTLFNDKRFNVSNERNAVLKQIASSGYDIDVDDLLNNEGVDPSVEMMSILSTAILLNKKKFIKSYLTHKRTTVTREQMDSFSSLAKKERRKDILPILEKIQIVQQETGDSTVKKKKTVQETVPSKRIKKLFYDE